jgi:hypothetical protein
MRYRPFLQDWLTLPFFNPSSKTMRIRVEYKKWLDSLKNPVTQAVHHEAVPNNEGSGSGHARNNGASLKKEVKEKVKFRATENCEEGTGDGYESTGSNYI